MAGMTMAGMNPQSRVDELNVSFGDSHVVKDLSFTVAPGESYGIVGESGSGKSTVLRVLVGPESRLERHGRRSTGKCSPSAATRRSTAAVQMVFQDPYGSLHPKKTVDDALAEPLAIHGIGDAEKRIGRAMAEVGLPPSFRFRYPHQLSGGQRQRVAIARALVLEPVDPAARRADLGARRLDPGGGAEPASGAAQGA